MNLKLSKEHKKEMVNELQQYYQDERKETIGNLESEALLNFVIDMLGPTLYNQAIEDARSVIMDRFTTLEDDLYALKKLDTRKK